MDEVKLTVSEDCKTLTIELGDRSEFTAVDVERAIRDLGRKRLIMEPLPDFSKAPDVKELDDVWVMNVMVVPGDAAPRVALQVATRQFGWQMFSVAVEAVPIMLQQLAGALLQTGFAQGRRQMQAPPPEAVRQ